jgi:hypothetical protein
VHISVRALLAIAAVGAISITGVFLFQQTPSLAVQNPTISLDMVTAGNTYDEATNTMTVGSTENCLTSATANAATHNHATHLVVRDIEDMIGWQVRLNYVGDQMRPLSFNPTPFMDNNTAQPVGFTNLPIDSQSGLHRDVTPASSIPAAPADGSNTPQTALIGATYSGTQTFPASADSPHKASPDDASYDAASGGVLGSLILQVVGNESGQPSLFMNLDDNDPNPPGSAVVVFTGTGTTAINPTPNQLGDGYHGEGATCAPLDCVTLQCPEVIDVTYHTFMNGTPLPASELHVRFSEAVTPRLVQNAPGCAAPTISGDHAAGRLDLVWDSLCVDPGENVVIEITSQPRADVTCSHWSILGHNLFGNCDSP